MQTDMAFKLGKLSFSKVEIKEIIKAWLAVSLAFAIVMKGSFLTTFLVAAITAGLGFLLHELAHKVVAQHYGAWAEFRAAGSMLVMGILLAFAGVIFLAPGAVWIQGRTIGISRNGKISAAGPLMNYFLAGMFLLFQGSIISSYGFQINAWLGLFNMIPFSVFDGAKVWAWNKAVYIAMVLVGFVLVALPSIAT